MMGKVSTLATWAALMCVVSPVAAQSPDRVQQPGTEEVAQAAKLVAEVYKQEYAAATTPEIKQALSIKMFEAAKAERDAAAKFALLRSSRKIAASIGDLLLVVSIVDAQCATFVGDEAALHKEVMAEVAGAAKSPLDHYLLARYVRRAIDRLALQDDPASALQMAQQALPIVRKSMDADLIKQYNRAIEALEAQASAFNDLSTARETLKKQPADPTANRLVGQYTCFYKGDWDAGLSMLALSDDLQLQPLAEKELKQVTTINERITLADGWFAAAQKAEGTARRALLSRANKHYQQAVEGATGLTQRRLQTRLAEIDQAINPFASNEWTEVLDLPNVTSQVDREWRQVGLTLVSGDGSDTITLPAPVDRSYELRIQAKDFVKEFQPFLFPDPYTTQVVINGWGGAHSEMYGLNHSYEPNSTRVKGFPPLPGITTFDFRVNQQGQEAAVWLKVNNRPYLAWKGNVDALKGPLPSASDSRLKLKTVNSPITIISLRYRRLPMATP
jgi:hypothetical protein